MNEEMLKEVETLAAKEGVSKSALVVELLNVLLFSEVGRKLQESAVKNRRTLAQQMETILDLFDERIPMGELAQLEEVAQLAEASQRTPAQMVIQLIRLGLRSYKLSNVNLESNQDDK